MIIAWVVFPLVLLVVCTGCGLLVEQIAGWQLPGTMLPSVGLAAVIVVATLTTSNRFTAAMTTPLVVAFVVVGYALSWRRLRAIRPEPASSLAGIGAFCVGAAPVVASGSAAFLGYFVLNDAAFHFSLVDQLLTHGPDISHVPPSSYRAVLNSYISTSYPIGADVALGAVRPLVGQDVAWVFQPYLAVIFGLGALALYELLSGVVRSCALRAATAFIAAQAGLVYAYYLQGSIKELATTWIITVTVVLVFATLRRRAGVRSVVPLIIAGVAGLDILDLAIVPWLAPPLTLFCVAAIWEARRSARRLLRRRAAIAIAASALLALALSAPIAAHAPTFFSTATTVLTTTGDLGNLAHPLSRWQIFGIWPSGDFRLSVPHYRLAFVLIGIAVASSVLGVVWLVRRRAWAPLTLVASDVIAGAYLLHRASPYAAGKVMMILSLTAVLAAMLGAAALHDSGRRLEAWGLAAAIAAGVLWTNWLGYQHSQVAPRAQLAELASIGTRFSGQGPAFYNLSNEFAVHFLRREAPFDIQFGAPPARPGVPLPPSRVPWDPNNVQFSYLESFPLLVLGGSPFFSRPPANYRLAYAGRYYSVWQRTPTPAVLWHVPVARTGARAAPSCRLVRSIAARAAAEHAWLAYAPRRYLPTMQTAQASAPAGWNVAPGPSAIFFATAPGTVTGDLHVEQAGRYHVWLDGVFAQPATVSVAGRTVGSVDTELGVGGQSVDLGTVELGAGVQPVALTLGGSALRAGRTVGANPLGPLTLVPAGPPPVVEIPPARASSVCGQSVDWLEIVR